MRLSSFVPDDPNLDGLELFFQTYTLHGSSLGTAVRSYGNVSSTEF